MVFPQFPYSRKIRDTQCQTNSHRNLKMTLLMSLDVLAHSLGKPPTCVHERLCAEKPPTCPHECLCARKLSRDQH